jgi:hypothetical protein
MHKIVERITLEKHVERVTHEYSLHFFLVCSKPISNPNPTQRVKRNKLFVCVPHQLRFAICKQRDKGRLDKMSGLKQDDDSRLTAPGTPGFKVNVEKWMPPAK